MSHLSLSQRFIRNPWPWLILLLIGTLAVLWLREYRVIRKELSTRPMTASTTMNDVLGPPTIHDPFGNRYYLLPLDPIATSDRGRTNPRTLIILTFNMDGTAARFIATNSHMEFTYNESSPATDLILPVLYSALFLMFTILWFRNAHRQCLQQP